MIVDPFQIFQSPSAHNEEKNAPQAKSGTQRALSLFELNVKVRTVLEHTLRQTFWVAAEVSELRVASNGHCYVEFVQKDEMSGSLIAKARGIIWRNTYHIVADTFRRATGRLLGPGIKVMVEVSVAFHELYGYSLNVLNIDPTYTIGDLAQRRREIIRQLEEDGVMELNKELPLPKVISRIAVISSASAAGYGDFCNQLDQSGLGFTRKLFPAIMQGDKVEESIIAALDAIAAEEANWDVVVIIRGGGSTTDLNGFDSYLLASNVAQFPLPVLTGIGHERDDTIVDLVAHTRLKTPTAVAAFLIESRSNEVERLKALQARLQRAATQQTAAQRQRFQNLSSQLSLAVSRDMAQRRSAFTSLAHRFELASSQYVAQQQQYLLQLSHCLNITAQECLLQKKIAQKLVEQRLSVALFKRFTAEHHRMEMIQRSIKLAGPERILAMGYSITLKNGRAVRSLADVAEGDILETVFATGKVRSTVNDVEKR